jgi:hypothetical protein
MTTYSRLQAAHVWKGGYTFALLVLFTFGIALIVIGTLAFPNGSLWNVILVNSGVAMAPAAVVAQLFRVFLFQEIKFELTQPVLDEVRDRLGPQIEKQVENMLDDYRKENQEILEAYRDEIETLQSLKEAGVVKPYRNRETALAGFASAIDSENVEIMIIGSSLKGLLKKEKYKEFANKLRFKMNHNVTVRFLLTHPLVADLRAGQEGRRSTEIGTEIIESLQTLKEWEAPPEHVRLYRGTPTCFAIRTEDHMLLNPYPYGEVAYDSPCFIVTTSQDRPSYIYHEFDKSHFGAWDTKVSVKIYNYDEAINDLQRNLATYSKAVSDLFKIEGP